MNPLLQSGFKKIQGSGTGLIRHEQSQSSFASRASTRFLVQAHSRKIKIACVIEMKEICSQYIFISNLKIALEIKKTII